MNKKALWPNLVTLGNLIVGFTAINMIGQGRYVTACWLILVAAIMDMLDGALARLVHSSSPFGAQIDSLSDIISFGVAPAYFLAHAIFGSFGFFGIVIAYIPLLAGAFRLARFNVMGHTKQNRKFFGLPIPTSALLIIGLYLYSQATLGYQGDMRIWFSMVPIVSLLMISPIPFWKVTKLVPKMLHQPFTGLPIFVIALVGMLWKPAYTLFPLMLIYTLLGPVEWGLEHLTRVRDGRSSEEDELQHSMPRRRNRRK